MSIPELRLMTHRDIDFVLHLQEFVGWGNTRADAERSLYYEPSGCFVASIDGVDVGIVNSYLYGDVGFIGNLIVLPETRGKGVGAALMKRAIRRLTEDGAGTIFLDAVQKAIPLYEKLNFKGEYWSLRYSVIADESKFHGVEQMTREDIEPASRLDRRFFGLDRVQKLLRIQSDFPELCFKTSDGGEVKGFIMAKPGTSNVRVGPWICDPDFSGFAEPLFNALSSKVKGKRLWIGIPEFNRASVKIIESRRFTKMPSSLRMSYGAHEKVDDVSGIYGIGAPDKG